MTGLILALAAASASAQPGGGGGPGGGGRGGRGGGMGMGMFNSPAMRQAMLLGSPDVQKELAITDDQKQKLNDLQQKAQEDIRSIFQNMGNPFNMSDEDRADMQKKMEEAGKKGQADLAKILDEKQIERLKQLAVQQQGVDALTDKDIVEKLKLSQESQDKIKKVIDDSRKNRPQFDFRNATDDERKEFFDKMNKQRADTMKSALAVLDDDQLVEWGKLTGKEFKFSQQGFGRGGFGFGGGRGGRGGGGGGPGGGGGGGPNGN
jgi:hypothetical protein